MADPPRVTVLMAVRNGAAHLREAIESILGQSFRDLEFLIIDDGSTDGSAAIVESCADPRIRFVRNEGSIGLADSLNRGIDLARGELVARMDADDVSLPSRLARQVAHMDAHRDCAVVGVKMQPMTQEGELQDEWAEDERTTTFEEIYRQLPRGNCIAHPGVMIRGSILRRYRYKVRRSAQDYDLWLRLCADGHRIEKIDERLLRYRLTPDSVSARRRMSRTGLQVEMEIRWLFLMDRVLRRRFNRFDRLVLKQVLADGTVHGARSVRLALRNLWQRLGGRPGSNDEREP